MQNSNNQLANQENKKGSKNWIIIALLTILFIFLGLSSLLFSQNNQLQRKNEALNSKVTDLERKIHEFESEINSAKPYNPIDNRFSGLLAEEPKTTGDYNLWIGETEIGRGEHFGALGKDKNIFEEMKKNNQDFCAVKVYVKNKGDKILTVSSDNFSMIDEDGRQVEQIVNATAPLFPNKKVDLYPGYEIQGYLTFKVRSLPKLLKLKFQPDDSNLEPIIFEWDFTKLPPS